MADLEIKTGPIKLRDENGVEYYLMPVSFANLIRTSDNSKNIEELVAEMERTFPVGTVYTKTGEEEEVLPGTPWFDSNGVNGVTMDSNGGIVNIANHDTTALTGLTVDGKKVAMDEAVNSEISEIKATLMKIYSGEATLSSGDGFSSKIPFPSGLNASNTRILNVEVQTSDAWRSGIGVSAPNTPIRLFAQISTDGIYVYNNESTLYGHAVRVLFTKV